MEAIAGLSLAANIAQFVVYGFQGARYLYKAYDQTAEFVREQSELSTITHNIRTSSDAVRAVPEAVADTELVKLLDQTKLLADELLHEFESLQRRASKPLAKARIAVHSLLVKSDVERLLKRLTALRDQVTARLIVLASQSRTIDRAKLDDLHPIIKSNHEEVSGRLDKLYDDLTDSWNEMKDSSEEKQGELFVRMTDVASATTKHCMLRKKVENILKSLQFANISDRLSAIPRAHKQTFQWALSETNATATLPDWLRSENGIYWVEGKAGSGKSTLMKFLQHDTRTTTLLKEWAGERPLMFVSHYFWAPGTELQRSLVGLFRTLLFQILVKDPELIDRLCPSRARAEGYDYLRHWSLDELESSFKTLATLASLPTKLCFFIDGLDEFEGNPRTLIDIIQSLASSRSGDVKFCVASRPWLRFQEAFGQSDWKLSVHEYTKDDIERYAHDCLGQNEQYKQLQSRAPDQAESLVREISNMADGVFLWVYLVVQDLLDGLLNQDDLPTLRRRLDGMPRELNVYFQRMLDSIDDVYRAEALTIFRILAYTRLPLNTLLTWSHRRFRKQSSTIPFDAYEFSCHTKSLSDSPSNYEWLYNRDSSPADDYDTGSEKRRVIARCKDLVHVSEDTTLVGGQFETHKIGFLHRTVAEFIGSAMAGRESGISNSSIWEPTLPRIERRDTLQLVDRDALLSQNPMLVANISLAEAYMELLVPSTRRRYTDTGPISFAQSRDQFIDWVIYLASQVQKHSNSAYLYVVWRLCLLLSLEAIDGRTFWRNDAIKVTGTAMALDVSLEKSCGSHGRVDTKLQAAFWILHCRGCTTRYFGSLLLPLCEPLCFQTHPQLVLSEDGTVVTKVHREVHLGVVETLVTILRADGTSRFVDAWISCVMGVNRLALFASSVEVAELSSAESLNATSFDAAVPDNIYDLCLVFIRHGAPRFLLIDEGEPDEGNSVLKGKDDDAVHLLEHVSQIQAADPQLKRLVKEFKNAKTFTPPSHPKQLAFWDWITGRIN